MELSPSGPGGDGTPADGEVVTLSGPPSPEAQTRGDAAVLDRHTPVQLDEEAAQEDEEAAQADEEPAQEDEEPVATGSIPPGVSSSSDFQSPEHGAPAAVRNDTAPAPSAQASDDELAEVRARGRDLGVLPPVRAPSRLTAVSGPVSCVVRAQGDTCSICFESWSNAGKHRVASLKCGHLFGRRWAEWGGCLCGVMWV